jgi:hypothetical protein
MRRHFLTTSNELFSAKAAVAQHGLVGDMQPPVDITYLAETVILRRYFEALGKVRRAISIIKKRTGANKPLLGDETP